MMNCFYGMVERNLSKFQNAHLQGYLFSQKLNKDTPL